MALLTSVVVSRESPRRVEVTLNTRRIFVVLALSVAALAVSVLLHGMDRETAAAWFTGMGEALLFGTFGLVIGEASGARDAEAKLTA